MTIGDVGTVALPPGVRDWLDALNDLAGTVKAWAATAGWETRLAARGVKEGGGVRHEVPVLELEREKSEISLVPVVRKVPGADGLVDLYVMPDFDAVASLYREAGRWVFHYAFHRDPMQTPSGGGAERFALDEASLHRVLNDIAAHA